MTIIAGFCFKEGSIVIADSRATLNDIKNKAHFNDSIQKIVPIYKNYAFAYAGNIGLASKIIYEIKYNIRKKEKLKIPQKLAQNIQRIARFKYENYGTNTNKLVYFIFAAVSKSGNVFLWSFEPPKFNPIRTSNNFYIAGSGSIIKKDIEQIYIDIDNNYNGLIEKANVLITRFESLLSQYSVNTVGGLFQIILLDSSGLRPLNYGYCNINPYDRRDAKRIEFKNGKWTQVDQTKNKKVEIIEPSLFLNKFSNKLPFDNKFQDYIYEVHVKNYNFNLCYFVPCLIIEKNIDSTIFKGVFSGLSVPKFPFSIPIKLALAFWGTEGYKDLKLYQIFNNVKKEIICKKIYNKYLPERYEEDFNFNLEINSPGVQFLECTIENKVIARKSLYFNKNIKVNDINNYEEYYDFISKELNREHSLNVDPSLIKEKAFLDYFILCQNCISKEDYLEFSEEIGVLYRNQFPIRMNLFVASQIRMLKGNHLARLTLVDIFTGKENEISNTKVISHSDCLPIPIHGNFIIQIPKAGLYWINLYIDEKLITSSLIIAETEKAKYSYSLREEDVERVKSGEFLVLPPRAQRDDQDSKKIKTDRESLL
jgi:hypothetical protein